MKYLLGVVESRFTLRCWAWLATTVLRKTKLIVVEIGSGAFSCRLVENLTQKMAFGPLDPAEARDR